MCPQNIRIEPIEIYNNADLARICAECPHSIHPKECPTAYTECPAGKSKGANHEP